MSPDLLAETPPLDPTTTHEGSTGNSAVSAAALVEPGESGRLRSRWSEIQGTFVDEPLSAVQQADALVSEMIGKITPETITPEDARQILDAFADEIGALESQWQQGSDVSTEDLRRVLQDYRSFFNRLVV